MMKNRKMKLFKSLKQNYPDCIVTYFNYENHIEKYNHIKDTCLSIGYDCLWKILIEESILMASNHAPSKTQIREWPSEVVV